MTATSADAALPIAHSLAEAITKNEEAKDAVQQVADELGVVQAVLTQEVADIANDGAAQGAVERTAALEQKLSETAEKMAEVNQALADQKASIEHMIKAQ